MDEYKRTLYALVIGTVAFLILMISGNYGIIPLEMINKITKTFVPAIAVGAYLSMKYNLKIGVAYFIGIALFLSILTFIIDKLL